MSATIGPGEDEATYQNRPQAIIPRKPEDDPKQPEKRTGYDIKA